MRKYYFGLPQWILLFLVVSVITLVGAQRAQADLIYDSWNGDATYNNPPVETVFLLTAPTTIGQITNYHWNNGNGDDASLSNGQIGIDRILSGTQSEVVGRWPAVSSGSAFGPKNKLWSAYPNVFLMPGKYRIIDSNKQTWSYTISNYYPAGKDWAPYKGFAKIYSVATPVYIVTPSVIDGNGTILPNANPVTVVGSSSATFTLAPAEGYQSASTVGGTCPAGTFSGSTYTTGTITSNCSVSFSFVPTKVTITTTTSGNGSITPASSTVNFGSNVDLTITPDHCYSLATLADNGGNVLGSVSNGTYTITNIIADHAVAATFVGDTVLPVLNASALANGSYTNNNVLNISGSVTDNCGFKELTINGVIVPVNSDGTFSYALILVNGPNLITAIATDVVGNKTSDTRTIILDHTAPELVISTPADNSKTANTLSTVSGTVNETSTVTVEPINSLGSNITGAAMNGTNFAAELNLVPGTNTILVTATDLAGNTSSQKRTVIYDDQKPSLAITIPAQDIRTNLAGLTIRGTVSDLYTAVTVSITMDGQTYTPAVVDGQFEQAVTFTTEKSYAIVVTAANETGTSTTAQRNVIYDTTLPAFSINPVTSPTILSSQLISGTREANATIGVTCATATVGTLEYPTDTTWRTQLNGLTLGDNIIVATAADAAGNRATAAALIKIVTSYSYLEYLANEMVKSGALPVKSADTLLATLVRACGSNTNLCDNMMNTFINQVNAAKNSGKISAATAGLLVNAANSVITNQGN